MDSRPIGVFDSGVGGLTVLSQVKKQLPNESVIYYGDLARNPYGSKSREEIIKINFDIISYLMERNVKMVVVACGTSSTIALEYDKEKFKIPIIGIIGPAANTAFALTKNQKIGIIATAATVKNHGFKNILTSLNNSLTVIEQGCPKFVPLIEAGKFDGPEIDAAIKEYLTLLLARDIDTLIFGCTHYPHIEAAVRRFVGPEIKFVNPAVGTVSLVREILEREEMLSPGPAEYEYVISAIQGGKYVRVDGRELLLRSASVIKK